MADKDEYYKEEKLTSGQKTKQFIWNSNTKEFLGRTGGSWAKLCVFYLIFYTCLAAFWAVMLLIFYQTIDYQEPKWKLDDSRIGTNPGLGYRPRPPAEKVESTLIWFKSGANGNWGHWSTDLGKFLDPYEKASNQVGEHSMGDCSSVASQDPNFSPKIGKYCRYNYRDMKTSSSVNASVCTKADDFGYQKGSPCVLIKLNRIFGWTPKPWDQGKAPDGLKKMIDQNALLEPKRVFITCEGENPADRENIGKVNYIPGPYIENYFFPYTNQPGYLSPFVFVNFDSPARGVLINVECKAWASNIEHNRMEREGSVHFELLID